MIASTRYGWPKTALSALVIVLLALSCHCHHDHHIDIGWIDHPGYTVPDTNKFPLKYQVVVWKNPDSSKEQYRRWLSDLKREVPNVQALAVCSHCDSDMLLLYDSTLLPYLQSQTVGGSGGGPSPGPSGNNGPTLYCSNYSVNSHDSAKSYSLQRGNFPPRIATNYTWPRPNAANALTVAVFDSGLDSLGSSVVATVGSTCFDTPPGMSSSHGWNFVDDNANTQDDMPDKHGTKVTKLILNQVQQFGGSNVNILPVKIFNANGQGTLFGILCGLAYASGAGAKIVNASFGFYHYSDTANAQKVETMLGAFMHQYLNATGMLLVAAAGNDDNTEDVLFHSINGSSNVRYLDSNRFYPAWFAKSFANVISVTTVAQRTQKPSPLQNASNTCVDVGAQCDTIAPDGSYVFIDPINPPKTVGGVFTIYTITGSSFAAPIVTGRIAALYSHLANKTDKHAIIPAMNTMANGRIVLTIDKALTDSIVHGELAP
jgi:hypothetical protein